MLIIAILAVRFLFALLLLYPDQYFTRVGGGYTHVLVVAIIAIRLLFALLLLYPDQDLRAKEEVDIHTCSS
jgi:uncharacterized membrane protein